MNTSGPINIDRSSSCSPVILNKQKEEEEEKKKKKKLNKKSGEMKIKTKTKITNQQKLLLTFVELTFEYNRCV